MALKPVYRRLIYVVIGIALFLVLLPEGIRLGARYALTEFGAQAAQIDDIDLNLFTGQVGISGVTIEYNGETTLSLVDLRLDLDMAALFSKQLLVEQFQIVDLSARAYENEGQWVAVLPIPQDESDQAAPETDPEESAGEDSPWKIGINALALERVSLSARYQGQEHNLTLNQLTASDLFMWEPQKQASLALKGQLNGATLDFDSGLKPFAQPRAFSVDIAVAGLDLSPVNQFLPDNIEHINASLDLDTRVSLELKANGAVGINQEGSVALSLKEARAQGIAAAIENIRWQGTVDVLFPPDSTATVAADGEAAVRNLKADYAGLLASTEFQALVWEGAVNVELPRQAQPLLTLKGGLSLENWGANQGTLGLAHNLADLTWQGDVTADLAAPDSSLTMQGNLNLGPWRVTDEEIAGQLLMLEALAVNQLNIQGLDDMSVGEVRLTGISAMNSGSPESADAAKSDIKNTAGKGLAALGSLLVKDINLNARNKLDIGSVALGDLNASLTRTEDGKIRVLDDWIAGLKGRGEQFQQELAANTAAPVDNEAGDQTTPAADGEDTDSSDTPFQFAVGKLSMDGENRFVFTDYGVEPDVIHPVSIKTLALGRLDSASSASLTPVDLEMSLYEYGTLEVRGKATPLQTLDALQADLKAQIKGVELPELSPYIENTLGYHANSGQLNLKTDATIKAGKLDSETRLKVLRMDLKPVDQALIDKLGKKLTMPVDTALSVITDSDNTLSLTIPVNGDLARPDIQLDRIIGGAVSQAVQNAALTYFKYAVQPFGAIMLVSEKIGDMTLQAKFEPARFVPGTADIVPAQSGYLEKVAAMIKEKKDLSVLVCVMVTGQDFKARENPPEIPEGKDYQWDPASEALAKARLDTIKNSLINTHGLSPDRVQTCRPQLGKGEPRAIMGI